MQTLKDVLGREEERVNLRNMVLCYVVTLLFVFAIFGVTYLKQLSRSESGKASSAPLLEDVHGTGTVGVGQ